MAQDLSYLFQGTQPNSVDTSSAASNGLPTWYQQYLSGIAGKATQIAGDQSANPVPTQSVAGFNGDQTQAFQDVRNNQNSWAPDMNSATAAAGSIQGDASGLVQQGINAVGGPSQSTSGQVAGYGNTAMGSVAGDAQNTSGQAAGYGNTAMGSVAGDAQNTAGQVAGYGNAAMAQSNGPAQTTAGQVAGYGNSAIGDVAGSSQNAGGAAMGYGGMAVGAAAGGTGTWDANAANQYMSPYTNDVVNNIQRLGLRNLNENLIPGVQDQFLGSGQFGSTRNADILGRTVRDASTDINGQVASALNSGYTNAQSMFTSDQARAQQQQQLQANTALGAGNMVSSTLSSDAARQQAQQSLQAQTALNAGTLDQSALSADAARQQAQQQFQTQTTLNAGNLAQGALSADATRQQQQQSLQAQTALNAGSLTQGALSADATRQQQQQSLQAQTALNAGSLAQGALSADANRAQQQQQMQGSADLQGAGLQTAADQSAASTLGALGQSTANLNLQDAQQLGAVGSQQQALTQQQLNTGYTNDVNTNQFDWNNLNNLNSVVRGLQLPQTAAQTTNSPSTAASGQYGASPLTQVGALGTAIK